MKKVLVLLLVVMLPLIASADITILDTTGANITNGYNDYLMDITSLVGTEVDSLCITSGDYTWIMVEEEINYDTTIWYIHHYDTVLVLHKIECDSSWTPFQRNDSNFIKDIVIECDSIYIENIKPVWYKKKAPLLTEKQMEMLMELLDPNKMANIRIVR